MQLAVDLWKSGCVRATAGFFPEDLPPNQTPASILTNLSFTAFLSYRISSEL